jgi:hypothetical protein
VRTPLVRCRHWRQKHPPADAGGRGALLLARIDELLDVGALEQAAALLDAAGSAEPELFRRSFDVALLTGTEDRACAQMRANPQLAPTFPARIFCLARSGDWNAAALTLRTAQALGFVTEEEDALLSRFLDPELYEGDPPLAGNDPDGPGEAGRRWPRIHLRHGKRPAADGGRGAAGPGCAVECSTGVDWLAPPLPCG